MRLTILAAILAGLLLLGGVTGGVLGQAGEIIVNPPSGPIGTSHEFLASGLTPNTAYRLDVIFAETSEVVFSATYPSDDQGMIIGGLISEPTDRPGMYVLHLFDGETLVANGEMVITGGAGSGPQPLAQELIQFGVPTQGSFERGYNVYQFEANAGDVITVQMFAPQFDAYLELYDPAISLIARNNDGGSGSDAKIRAFQLPETGLYSIKSTSADGQQGGTYTLLLTRGRAAIDGPIASGELVLGRLEGGAQSAEYRFNANAGDTVRIELSSTDFDPLVRLINPNGSQLAANDDAVGKDSMIDRAVLPETGEYTIVIDGFRGLSGEREISGAYALSFEVLGADGLPVISGAAPSQPQQAQPTALPQQPTGDSIAYGQSVQGAFTPQVQNARYTFSGAAGDIITIDLDAPDFDAQLYLLDSQGREIAFDDDSGSDLNPRIENFTLPESGAYVVIVDGYRGVNGDRTLEGAYTLTLNSANAAPPPTPTAPPVMATPTMTPTPTALPATPTPLPTIAPATAEPTTEAQVPAALTIAIGETVQGTATGADVVYQFEATAGTVISIALSSSEFDPLARLLAADGSELAYDDDSGGSLAAAIENFTLPADGTYQIVVSTYAGENNRTANGAFTLTLSEGITEPPIEGVTPQQPEATFAPSGITAPTLPEGVTPAPVAYNNSVFVPFLGEENELHAYSFSALKDDVVTVSVDSSVGIDTALYLVDQDNNVVGYDEDSGAGFDPEIANVQLVAGTYTVIVVPELPRSRGTVQFTVNLISPTEIKLGQPTTIRLDSPDVRQVIIVREPQAGDLISLAVVSQSALGGQPTITVTQGGQVIAQNSIGLNLRLVLEFFAASNEPISIVIEGGSGVLEMLIEVR